LKHHFVHLLSDKLNVQNRTVSLQLSQDNDHGKRRNSPQERTRFEFKRSLNSNIGS